jgi:hypothetical protein
MYITQLHYLPAQISPHSDTYTEPGNDNFWFSLSQINLRSSSPQGTLLHTYIFYLEAHNSYTFRCEVDCLVAFNSLS